MLLITPLIILAISITILTGYFIYFTISDYNRYTEIKDLFIQIIAILTTWSIATLAWIFIFI